MSTITTFPIKPSDKGEPMKDSDSPLSVQDHSTVAAMIATADDHLTAIQEFIAGRPGIVKRHGKHGMRMRRALQQLRSDLENVMFVQHPGEASTDVYYPPRKPEPIREERRGADVLNFPAPAGA